MPFGNPYSTGSAIPNLSGSINNLVDNLVRLKTNERNLDMQARQLQEATRQHNISAFGTEQPTPGMQTVQSQLLDETRRARNLEEQKFQVTNPQASPWNISNFMRMDSKLKLAGVPVDDIPFMNELKSYAADPTMMKGDVAQVVEMKWPEWTAQTSEALAQKVSKLSDQAANIPETDPKRKEIMAQIEKTINAQKLMESIPADKVKATLFPDIHQYEQTLLAAQKAKMGKDDWVQIVGPDGKPMLAPASANLTGQTPFTEPKSKTEEQLTAAALGGDKQAQAVLDAMQARKIETARAGAAALAGEKDKAIDLPSLAAGVINGQDAPMAIKGSMGNPVATKVKSEIYKQYPKFNFSMADANYKWKQSAVNQRTINFAGGALPRLTALDEQLSALPNVDLNIINRIMAATSKEFGKPEYTNFESNRNAIVQEVNTALSGSSQTSDMKVKIELDNLKEARSPAQIRGAISNLREALIARVDVDLSPLYPIEVVRGEKTMEEYKSEMFKKYRGNYGKAGGTNISPAPSAGTSTPAGTKGFKWVNGKLIPY